MSRTAGATGSPIRNTVAVLPLRIVEKDHEDFDQPIVEIWREDEFVAYVFWDDDVPVAQIYSDEEGDAYDLDAVDLIRVLEIAHQIVSPLAPDDGGLIGDKLLRDEHDDAAWTAKDDRIAQLSGEFDSQAAHRSLDGEGFFSRSVAEALIARCDALDVAVVEMEGFDFDGSRPVPRPNMHLIVHAEPGATWSSFRPQANFTVLGKLNDWPRRETLVVSFVVQLPESETVVL